MKMTLNSFELNLPDKMSKNCIKKESTAVLSSLLNGHVRKIQNNNDHLKMALEKKCYNLSGNM